MLHSAHAYVLFLKSFLTAVTHADELASARLSADTSSPSAFIIVCESSGQGIIGGR